MAQKKVFKITKNGRRLLYAAFAVFLILDILAKFNIANSVRAIAGNVGIPLVVSLFILLELSIFQLIKGKRKYGFIESLGFSAAVINLVLVALVLIGLSSATFLAIVGIFEIVSLVYALIELFRGKK